jgi:predicted phage terminase large subunit-like protein
MEKMGYRSAQKEYFHEHIEEGLIFQNKWIHWVKAKDYKDYNAISVYCDPSFKDGKGNDFKAIIAAARYKEKFDVLKAFVRQCSTTAMVQGFYDMFELFGKSAKYWMEANFLQDILLCEFDREAEIRGQTLPIRADKEKKVDKFTRIENLTPFFERGLVGINEAEKQSSDMLILIDQLLGFGNPSIHDDAPDALEGAISKLQKAHKKSDTTYMVGNYSHKNRKY